MGGEVIVHQKNGTQTHGTLRGLSYLEDIAGITIDRPHLPEGHLINLDTITRIDAIYKA